MLSFGITNFPLDVHIETYFNYLYAILVKFKLIFNFYLVLIIKITYAIFKLYMYTGIGTVFI